MPNLCLHLVAVDCHMPRFYLFPDAGPRAMVYSPLGSNAYFRQNIDSFSLPYKRNSRKFDYSILRKLIQGKKGISSPPPLNCPNLMVDHCICNTTNPLDVLNLCFFLGIVSLQEGHSDQSWHSFRRCNSAYGG